MQSKDILMIQKYMLVIYSSSACFTKVKFTNLDQRMPPHSDP